MRSARWPGAARTPRLVCGAWRAPSSAAGHGSATTESAAPCGPVTRRLTPTNPGRLAGGGHDRRPDHGGPNARLRTRLRRHGLPIFPLWEIERGRCACSDPACPPKSVGKHPVTRGWQKALASVPAARTAWGGRRGARGIGLALGERAGMWALDVDPRPPRRHRACAARGRPRPAARVVAHRDGRRRPARPLFPVARRRAGGAQRERPAGWPGYARPGRVYRAAAEPARQRRALPLDGPAAGGNARHRRRSGCWS